MNDVNSESSVVKKNLFNYHNLYAGLLVAGFISLMSLVSYSAYSDAHKRRDNAREKVIKGFNEVQLLFGEENISQRELSNRVGIDYSTIQHDMLKEKFSDIAQDIKRGGLDFKFEDNFKEGEISSDMLELYKLYNQVYKFNRVNLSD